MSKNIITTITTLLIGVILTLGFMYKAAPGLMMKVDASKYDYAKTIETFEAAVKTAGWKIITKHDLQKSMKKFGKNVKPVIVIELCHPDLAGKILEKSDERIVSSLMPCRVSFYEKDDGKVYISRMNSSLMASMMGGIIPEVMDSASKETEVMLNTIIAK